MVVVDDSERRQGHGGWRWQRQPSRVEIEENRGGEKKDDRTVATVGIGELEGSGGIVPGGSTGCRQRAERR